ncbi:hypothetical protein [Sphingomonas sp. KC8]|uniref:hypothetical protein n=1 Tax=Sphingomonas sp. KC8 TaxID=1030157 RepID=UPI0002D99DFC|nr:hypothetical protein [Sphingomonas sp. KC8]
MSFRFPPIAGLLIRAAPFALIAATPLSPAVAQDASNLISPGDPAESLGRYVRMLAANPRDLASLTGAGRAALLVGDPSAALGFFRAGRGYRAAQRADQGGAGQRAGADGTAARRA